MEVFCGIDWAEDHHDIALVDAGGSCWPGAASATTRPGSPRCWTCSPSPATAPKTRSRWRSRPRAGCWSPACAPPADGLRDQPDGGGPLPRPALASPAASPTTATRWCWPTSCAPTWHAHRPLPADSELAQAIAVLARAQQDAVWARTAAHNKLRSQLREYYPGFLAAFADARGGILRPEARAILAAAPTPAAAAAAHPSPAARPAAQGRPQPRHRRRGRPAARGRSAHRRCASSRWSRRPWAARPSPCSASSTPPAPPPTNSPQAAIESFDQHPDAEIITSFPGLGPLTGARVLAEIGDDRSRFADAQATQGLRRRRAHHPRQRQKPDRHAPAGQEPAPGRRRLPLGLRRPHRLTRRPRPLRPAQDTPATGTPPPSATCSTASSAACTTAWPPASTTTKTPPSPPPPQATQPPQLDKLNASDVCPACASRVPKPKGRQLSCLSCGHTGHRDLLAAANIAARAGGGITSASLPADVTHRRAGAHLPGVASSRRDPRRRAHHRGARGSPGRHRPARASPPGLARESLATRRGA